MSRLLYPSASSVCALFGALLYGSQYFSTYQTTEVTIGEAVLIDLIAENTSEE
jgi:hypothetical protein